MMNRPPAFQFYAKDWLSSPTVRNMSMHHRGIYVSVLAAMWDSEEPGTLPLPIEVAARSAGIDPRSLRDFVAKFPKCFEIAETSTRLRREIAETSSRSHVDVSPMSVPMLVNLKLRAQWREMQQRQQMLSDAGKRGNEKRWEQSSGGDSGGDRSASASASALDAVRSDRFDGAVENPNPVQQPISFKELAAKKKHPAPSWAKGELAEDLYRGIHHEKISNTFFDSRHLSPREQLLTCITVAVTSLVTARVARLKVLNAAEIEARAFQELLGGLETLAAVRDFETRRQQTARAVTRVVVEQCVRMLEHENEVKA